MTDEQATTKRKSTGTETAEVAQVSGIRHAPDAALAVNAQDLQDLIEHARKTGAEALAAKFPNL